MFERYKIKENNAKILLIYLLLNNYNLESVERLEEIEEDRLFDLKIRKIYGLTKDFVDYKKIEKDIESIIVPIVCSPASFEYYSNEPSIYVYSKKEDNDNFVINDLNIISKTMVITDNCVISSRRAVNLQESECERGFEFFKEYVITNKLDIKTEEENDSHLWQITYKDNIFEVKYDGNSFYSAIEIDKTSTYKLVIYIIKKTAAKVNCWKPDSYHIQEFEVKQ